MGEIEAERREVGEEWSEMEGRIMEALREVKRKEATKWEEERKRDGGTRNVREERGR